MMYLGIKIEDFNRINLDEFISYCKKKGLFDDVVLEGSGLIQTIKTGDTRLDLRLFKDFDEKYNFEEMKIEDIIKNCFYEVGFTVNNEEQLVLGVYVAKFIALNTNIVLYNDIDICMTGEALNNLDDKEFELILEEFKINFKYYPKVKELNDSMNKEFNQFNGLSLVLLIGTSLLSALLMVYMIFVLKITNGFVISIPLVLAIFINLYRPFKNIINSSKASKQLAYINYDKSIEICKLYNIREPKMASINRKNKNYKQIIINAIGIMLVPAIVVGVLLLVYSNYILGIFIILLPWILLILIKIFVSDAETNDVIMALDLLTSKLWPKEEGYVGIKYQLTEKSNHNWHIEIGGYTLLNTKTINDLDNENQFHFLDLSTIVKYNGNWEELENIVKDYLCSRFINSKEFIDRDYIRILSVGFSDGREKIVYDRDYVEALEKADK